MHQQPGYGYGNEEGQGHQLDVVHDQFVEDALSLSAEDLLDGHVPALLQHVVGAHGQQAQGGEQYGYHREYQHDFECLLLVAEILLYLIPDVFGLELAVRTYLMERCCDLSVCLARVSVYLDQDSPRELVSGVSVVIVDHRGGLGVEQGADLEVIVNTADRELVAVFKDYFRGGLVQPELAEGVLVEPPGGLGGVVVLLFPDAQYLEICVIPLELLEGNQSSVVVHGVVVGAVQGSSLAQPYGVYTAELQ